MSVFTRMNPRQRAWAWTVGLFVVALWPRLFLLDAMLNIDAVLYWSHRIQQFWDGLSSGEYENTFQTHPGVTLMWASGFSQKLAGVLHAGPSEEFIVPAKLPVALFGSFLVAANYALLRRVLSPAGEAFAVISSLGLATEPFVVAQSRSLHVDSFFTGFAWLAVLFAILGTTERQRKWAALCGVCLGLGLLSRATCIVVCVGVGLWFVLEALRDRRRAKELSALLVLVVVTTAATAILLWPALLHDPVGTFGRLVDRTTRMVSRGHPLFFLGELYRYDPGASYYLVLFVLKTSPEMMLGLACGGLGLVGIARKPERRLLLGIFVSYTLLLVLLLGTDKKGGRYMLPLYPPLIAVATSGFLSGFRWLQTRMGDSPSLRIGLSFVVVVFALRAARLLALHPVPAAWCPEYPGLRCERVITMGGGPGLREVALHLRNRHSPGSAARVYYTPYARGLSPWYEPELVNRPHEAEYLLSYLPERQRGVGTKGFWGSQFQRYMDHQEPVLTVEVNGIRYADLFLGPAHPDYGK